MIGAAFLLVICLKGWHDERVDRRTKEELLDAIADKIRANQAAREGRIT